MRRGLYLLFVKDRASCATIRYSDGVQGKKSWIGSRRSGSYPEDQETLEKE